MNRESIETLQVDVSYKHKAGVHLPNFCMTPFQDLLGATFAPFVGRSDEFVTIL